MIKRLQFLWWDWSPSVEIRVFYRMQIFVQSLSDVEIIRHCMKTSYDRLSPIEREYILSRFPGIETLETEWSA